MVVRLGELRPARLYRHSPSAHGGARSSNWPCRVPAKCRCRDIGSAPHAGCRPLNVPSRAHEIEDFIEESRIGLFRAGIVGGEGGVERIAELLPRNVRRPSGGHSSWRSGGSLLQAALSASALSGKRLPGLGGIAQALAIPVVRRKTELRRDREIDAHEIIREEIGILGIASRAIERSALPRRQSSRPLRPQFRARQDLECRLRNRSACRPRRRSGI